MCYVFIGKAVVSFSQVIKSEAEGQEHIHIAFTYRYSMFAIVHCQDRTEKYCFIKKEEYFLLLFCCKGGGGRMY